MIFSGHAIRRMFEREVSSKEVIAVVESGEVTESYPDDLPYPSFLMLGFISGRAIHVVVAQEQQGRECYIITAYPPDPKLWNEDFKSRRQT